MSHPANTRTDDQPTLFQLFAGLIIEHGLEAVEQAFEEAAAEAIAQGVG